MSRQRSIGSFFWGFILIGVGLIFLSRNLGYEIPIWSGIALYWPVLLIVWGVIKLVEYVSWKREGQPGPLFSAGEVVMLIIVVLSGTALTAASDIGPDFNSFFEVAGIDFEILGEDFQYSEHYEKDVPAGAQIEIINRYGNVEVTPADTNRISVDVAKTIRAKDQMQADELSRILTYSIAEEGGRYRVISTYNRDTNRVRGRRFQTSLTVRVPRNAALTVNNRNGDVDISGLTGDQNIQNGFGATMVSRITGAVKIDSRNDRVIAEDITGATDIKNEFGSVEARRVAGSLKVKHRNGNIEIEDIKGDTELANEFGSIVVKKVQGQLAIDSRMTSVEVIDADSNVKVENEFNGVKIENARGSVEVENRNGNVDLRYLQPPRNNIRVTSRFGDVQLVLPSSSNFSIDARTRYASVSSDFDGLTASQDPSRSTLMGQVGSGGPEIRIENQNGNISIQK